MHTRQNLLTTTNFTIGTLLINTAKPRITSNTRDRWTRDCLTGDVERYICDFSAPKSTTIGWATLVYCLLSRFKVVWWWWLETYADSALLLPFTNLLQCTCRCLSAYGSKIFTSYACTRFEVSSLLYHNNWLGTPESL